MNPLQKIILDWIGKNKPVHERDWDQADRADYYNDALSDLRARVPELVEKITNQPTACRILENLNNIWKK